ncbi:hypothetical protein GGI35DRAFT_70303 [Trichoderma velutinum]
MSDYNALTVIFVFLDLVLRFLAFTALPLMTLVHLMKVAVMDLYHTIRHPPALLGLLGLDNKWSACQRACFELVVTLFYSNIPICSLNLAIDQGYYPGLNLSWVN